jgi:hypothetical protein
MGAAAAGRPTEVLWRLGRVEAHVAGSEDGEDGSEPGQRPAAREKDQDEDGDGRALQASAQREARSR